MSPSDNTRGFVSLKNISHAVPRVRHLRCGVGRARRSFVAAAVIVAALLVVIAAANGQQSNLLAFIANGVFFPNPNGASQTYSSNGGGIDLTGPFFQSLGTNGRTCATCHQPSDGMSVSAANVQLRFLLTQGRDPIFRPVDGSDSWIERLTI